jgi:hypothetical protein
LAGTKRVSIGGASFQPTLVVGHAKSKDKVMSKQQKSNKEARKVPVMTAKEKKAAKKAKKNERGRIGE